MTNSTPLPRAPLPGYIRTLSDEYRTGNATEHTHRLALQKLLAEIYPTIKVTNEPKQIACGAPDLLLTQNNIPIGYVETKDIASNLDDKIHKEQLQRYTQSLGNLIFTNYLEFRLFRDGKQVDKVTIGDITNKQIKPNRKNFAHFTDLLQTFTRYDGQTITTADALAQQMAQKARLLAGTITRALPTKNDTTQINAQTYTLQSQLDAFKKYLIHDINETQFADVYAQTVAYGMFAARLHDDTLGDFTRQKAAELIPATNPFLQNFFQHIAGYQLDERIRWIVNELADTFRATDVGELMKGYGKATQREDPFLHFYETFLGEYDPRLRKSRGVYYTPEPVVDFIVRAVDEILRTQFNLPDGLADTRKTTIPAPGDPATQKEVHKVQILDPATGTGTFLAAIVRHIHASKFAQQQGMWSGYVRDHLIPRLNGFEVLMASYAMAHTKLEMELRETGCELGSDRLRIYLTNSLEEHHKDTGTLFVEWLSAEANEANAIKRDTPVMVVIGNPPYAVSSSNKGEWIQNLISDYKKNLNERKLNLDDDYIKFIRYGEYLVSKTGEGVLAYISNNSFLDGITHRQMRKHLLETFDKIYILDLHGNTRKRETAPDGSADKNVFDIMQGVSINLFIKTGKKESDALASVFHYDLFGERQSKYEFLWNHDFLNTPYQKIETPEPYYFFVPKDFSKQVDYDNGFKLSDLCNYSAGVGTKVDHIAIDFSENDLRARVSNILNNRLSLSEIKDKYGLNDNTTWEYKPEYNLVFAESNIVDYEYRPFDMRKIYFDDRFLSRSRSKIMNNFFGKENVGLETSRNGNDIFIGKFVSDEHYASAKSFKFPLYLYPDEKQQTLDGKQTRTPNLNADIVQTIATNLGLTFTPEKDKTDPKTFAPIDLLDYIYAVLHAPTYRTKYKEFLKIDFPRVPYPVESNQFWQLVELGGELRTLHLMENPRLDTLITAYPTTGSNIVDRPEFKLTDPKTRTGNIQINPTQSFERVPELAWNFQIGGYQPAQKWLKDRKNRPLTSDDLTHYQKIIVALVETDKLMKQIDKTSPP